ncbi:MAG: rRNA maturation RNase YbeY [Acidobacteriota bacterium]
MRPWLEPMVSELAPEAESFGIRFVSDREMRRLNASYRSKDETTDVLSFPGDLVDRSDTAWAGIPGLGAHLGDVVVSVPTARRQAATAGHSADREVRVLLLHGVLHCLGYDHETDDGTMERLETGLRQRFIGSADGVVS